MLTQLSIKSILKALTAASLSVIALVSLTAMPVTAASSNDIIYGGVDSVAELKQKFNNGDGRNSAANIQAVFEEAIGVTSSSEFDGMVMGYIYRNGDVKVDGETVATDATSTGRENFRNSKPLGNTGAYYESTDVRFSDGTNRVEALVQLNQHGKFMFAVQTSCGNPSDAEPTPQPVYRCESLTADKTTVDVNESIKFTATPFTKDGATVKNYEFDFGDGNTQTVTNNMVTHSYDEAGNYDVSVLITFRVDGEDKTREVPARCKLTITVEEEPQPEPAFQCEALTIDNSDGDNVAPRRVDFMGRASVTDTDITGYTYVVLDGNGSEVEREKIDTDATDVEFSYLFDQPGDYSVYLLVHTADGDTERVSDCEVQITADEQPEEEPEPQPEIVKTGIFSATAGVLGTTGIWVGFKKWLISRRELINNLMSK